MDRDRLNLRQRKYAKLVSTGMDENDAAREAGYSKTCLTSTVSKLRSNDKVLKLIESYEEGPIVTNEVADSRDRQIFWTNVMNDPSYSANARLEASKLLGKCQGDFDRKPVVIEEKEEPIVMMPDMSPSQWEEHWENTNE